MGIGWTGLEIWITSLGYDAEEILYSVYDYYAYGSSMPDSDSPVGDFGSRLAVSTCRLPHRLSRSRGESLDPDLSFVREDVRFWEESRECSPHRVLPETGSPKRAPHTNTTSSALGRVNSIPCNVKTHFGDGVVLK